MTTPAHMISASLIALTATKTSPDQTSLVITTLALSGLPDLDHLLLLFTRRHYFKENGYQGQLHMARSILHEIPGFLLSGLIALSIAFFNKSLAQIVFLALTIHLAQDMLIGKSFPFAPIDKTEIKLFSFTTKHKFFIDLLIYIIFGGLWVLYLNGQL